MTSLVAALVKLSARSDVIVENIGIESPTLKVPMKQPKRGRLWLNDGSCVRLNPERRTTSDRATFSRMTWGRSPLDSARLRQSLNFPRKSELEFSFAFEQGVKL